MYIQMLRSEEPAAQFVCVCVQREKRTRLRGASRRFCSVLCENVCEIGGILVLGWRWYSFACRVSMRSASIEEESNNCIVKNISFSNSSITDSLESAMLTIITIIIMKKFCKNQSEISFKKFDEKQCMKFQKINELII